MEFTEKITLVSPSGESFIFKGYIYDDDSISQNNGIFVPSKKHIAIIKTDKCPVKCGFHAHYREIIRLVTAVSDNTKKSKIMPHIKLTLE